MGNGDLGKTSQGTSSNPTPRVTPQTTPSGDNERKEKPKDAD